MSVANESPLERRLFTGVFVAVLAAHFALVCYHLRMPFLPGNEFRQVQTALISYYIDKDNNFSPFYEQPIFGKPWTALILEFPLYQWCVVGLSRATGWEHFVAARVISITCFYAMLPALYLLLGRFGLARPRRLLVLALVAACPVYIFYTRAFLIDAMAFMAAAWFAAGFVRTMDRRSGWWLAVTVATGTVAALVKSFIFLIWLGPTAAYGAWMLWRDLRARSGWQAPLATVLWGAATVAPELGALKWWLAVTDPLKAAHPSTTIFTSQKLSLGNWGLFQFDRLFSRSLWSDLFARWGETMMHPGLLLALVVGGIAVLPKARRPAAGLFMVFLLTQVLFPNAYAWQDYYFYSCAVFVAGALGFVLFGVWDSTAPRWAGVTLLLLVLGANARSYWVVYRPQQAQVSMGKMDFTENIKTMTPPGSVLVLAGYDWAPMIPYYTERRALMIRNSMEKDPVYLRQVFRDLQDETVYALVVSPYLRDYRPFLDVAIPALDMDPVPVFSSAPQGDVYVSRIFVEKALHWINDSRNRFQSYVTFPPRSPSSRHPMLVPRPVANVKFPMFSPLPQRVDFEYESAKGDYRGDTVLTAHADSYIWVRPPAAAKEITIEFGIIDAAWQQAAQKTNGVEFVVYCDNEVQGGRRVIYRRLLDPVANEQDRTLQTARVEFTSSPYETLCFATLSNGSKTLDWAFWKRVEVR